MSIKNNTTSLQNLLEMVNNLPDVNEGGSGVELPTLTNEGSASDLLSGKQLIDGEGNVITGTIPTKTESNLTTSGATVTVPAGYYASQATKSVATATQATPTVSIDSAGKITASATQTAGYVSAGTKTGTKQLTTQAAKTVTPSKSSQTAVASGVYTTGAVTVAAIPSQYITTTDATASADEIMSGKTAYVNGSKIIGTFSIDNELSTQDNLIAQIQAAVDELPEAEGSGGSGGVSIETCIGTIDYQGAMGAQIYFLDKNLTIQCIDAKNTSSFEVVKNSIIYSDGDEPFINTDGNIFVLQGSNSLNIRVGYVLDDFTMVYSL